MKSSELEVQKSNDPVLEYIHQIDSVKVPRPAQDSGRIEDEMRQYTVAEFDKKAKQFTEYILNKG